MSKLTFQVALSIVISLVVIAGVYASVQALSLTASQESNGTYALNGRFVNQVQMRSVAGDAAGNQQFEAYKGSSQKDRDCGSEWDSSDY